MHVLAAQCVTFTCLSRSVSFFRVEMLYELCRRMPLIHFSYMCNWRTFFLVVVLFVYLFIVLVVGQKRSSNKKQTFFYIVNTQICRLLKKMNTKKQARSE